MTIMSKMLAGGLGLAALAAAAPAAAQYQYGYYPPYGNAYGYYANNPQVTQMAVNQCSAAVQNRLQTRTGLTGILGAVLGAQASGGRVMAITRVDPRSSGVIRVRGVANSGRYAYSPYGYGMYGAAGAGYQPDLSFKCDVDRFGRIRDIDINRRY